jgi:hypothetical protein
MNELQRRIAFCIATALLAIAFANLFLVAPADVPLYSWNDLVAAVCSIVITGWPRQAEQLLRGQGDFDWRGLDFLPPPETSVRYQPALLVLAAGAGWYTLLTVISWTILLVVALHGIFPWREFLPALLRPFVAWNLVSTVTRYYPAASNQAPGASQGRGRPHVP